MDTVDTVDRVDTVDGGASRRGGHATHPLFTSHFSPLHRPRLGFGDAIEAGGGKGSLDGC